MSQLPKPIEKSPILKPAEDFYRLRREGIGFIEQMASQLWTDYNIHDPGITILESCCYIFTDIAYRIGWEIKDLLARESKSSPDPNPPFPGQAFFTAREILTVNPVTPDDFRRLLIDLKEIRNAWVFANECACDVHYYAWCDKDQLRLSYQSPPLGSEEINKSEELKKVEPIGLYEILLELESDRSLGDLNDRKIEHTMTLDGMHTITMELRFPEPDPADSKQWARFLGYSNEFHLTKLELGAVKGFDVFTEFPDTDESKRNQYIRDHWRDVFYLNLTFEFGTTSISIQNATLRLFGDVSAKHAIQAINIKDILADTSTTGCIQRYRNKALAKQAAVIKAKPVLHSHRNLDEDYCSVKIVGVEEVAVCADVEVKPDADIEWVQARIWLEIEHYFNPPIPFHSLQELMDAGSPVEENFNGPELDSGFIRAMDLEAAALKTMLRTSDIINLLMDIEGLIAVNQLQLSKYDSEGNIVKSAADPIWKNGKLDFEPNKTSASWVLVIGKRHQPRLYLNASRFLFFKNGLPFNPRMDEAYDTLTQMRGEAERPKNDLAAKDLPIPTGTFRNPEDYFPLQHGFPLTYGIGPNGLPAHASDLRKAQAKQLKAYLMVFEQLLGNALAQLGHSAELFSLDPDMKRTYFVREFSEVLIQGFDEINNGLDKATVENLCETQPEFLERRNRFLDHLMARFGEQFSEYALLLSNLDGKRVALDKLITDKIAFLKAYPLISHDRAKAFNYTQIPCTQDNIPGIKKRVSLLLGYPDLKFVWLKTNHAVGKFKLTDRNDENNIWLQGDITPDVANEDEAYRMLIKRMILPEAYHVAKYTLRAVPTHKYHLHLRDNEGDLLGDHLFESKADAQAMMDELLAWSVNERLIVVEHLLLRPKFPGDALYPACSTGSCMTCGDEDPYSFRLTFVMPAWAGNYADNLDMRRFAERAIQQETPSHLISKICWVGNDGLVEDLCGPVIVELAELLLRQNALTSGKEEDACACASDIYESFSTIFQDWFEERALDYFHPNAVNDKIEEVFKDKPAVTRIRCFNSATVAWDDIRALMVKHFRQVTLQGCQFERFEKAWQLWLKSNAEIDWVEERLHERVQTILFANLTTSVKEIDVCLCAKNILEQYGMAFYQWMEDNLAQGKGFDDLQELEFNFEPASLCANLNDSIFKTGTADAVKGLLKDRYNAYKEASYRLRIVVNLLSELRNIYPEATLHDCDDGSDHNPVRLGNTALGSLQLKTSTS